ncbi:hypothetical protein [Algivirga pacifica]|uniref:hypothetical protein n=1 Tax=Algivirga pacifica TaxID=1162670 RepID=UPI0031E7CB8E
MSLTKYVYRINHLDYLIRTKSSGTPQECAEKMGISTRHLFQLISEIRSTMQADIRYSRFRQTYYFFQEGDSISIPINK